MRQPAKTHQPQLDFLIAGAFFNVRHEALVPWYLCLRQSHGFEVEVRQQLPCIAEGALGAIGDRAGVFKGRED